MEELWKDVVGTDGMYQVSSLGKVRSCKGAGRLSKKYMAWRILKPRMVAGYRKYHICIGSTVLDKATHRLMWEAFNGPIPSGYHVDHVDLDKMNNALTNLRLVTPQQNSQHGGRKYTRKTAYRSSKYRGVYWNKRNRCWVVRIFVDNKLLYAGGSQDEMVAAKLYNEAATRHFGEYAGLNLL